MLKPIEKFKGSIAGWLVLAMLCLFTLPVDAQTDYSDCVDYGKNGDFAEGIRCLNVIIKKNPKDVKALGLRSIAYWKLEQNQSALSDIDAAIQYHSKKDKDVNKDMLYICRAKINSGIEEYDEALKDYTAALKINSKNSNAFFGRANLYYTLEKYDASDSDLKQVLSIDKENLPARVGLARNMIAREQIDEAITELNRLERKDNQYAQIYQYRAEAYFIKCDFRKAIDDAVDFAFYDDFSNYSLNDLRFYSDFNRTYAIAKMSSMIVKDNNNKERWLNERAGMYYSQQDYNKAFIDYDALVKATPTQPIFYKNRGICYGKLGDTDKAIADFSEAININENYMTAWDLRADAYADLGNYTSSISDYDKVLELAPMYYLGYQQRGWVKERAGDFQGALADYSTAVEIEPAFSYGFFMRGRLYKLELKNQKLARQDFEQVLALTDTIEIEDCPEKLYVLHFLGRDREAAVLQDTLLRREPTASNYYNATCLYSLMNRTDEAVNFLQTAFKKGYKEFSYMETDTDLDNIRKNSKFIKLVKEWKDKAKTGTTKESQSVTVSDSSQKYVVKTKELKSGVYEISCSVNDLPLKFIFDTGASDITISSLDAAFMLKNNHLSKYDFRDRQHYRTASGELVEGTKVSLRKIKIGELELNNIEAAVVHKQDAPLLFGQSALGKFVKITIDNKRSEITFEK
jgi:clan AA aspartic protease (TIGR02281 family)